METNTVSTPPIVSTGTEEAPSSGKGGLFAGGISIILTVAFFFILSFLYNYGAAKLAMSIPGNGFMMGLVAYMFSGFYYPYFAFFKNNQCSTSNLATSGGARRK